MAGQVRDIHVAPFQGKNHPYESLYNQGGQVGVIGDKDYLLLHEDG